MAGTDLRGGQANGKRTWTSMKMLENRLMADRSHLILSDRPAVFAIATPLQGGSVPALGNIKTASEKYVVKRHRYPHHLEIQIESTCLHLKTHEVAGRSRRKRAHHNHHFTLAIRCLGHH
jgi:hypothetical protein